MSSTGPGAQHLLPGSALVRAAGRPGQTSSRHLRQHPGEGPGPGECTPPLSVLPEITSLPTLHRPKQTTWLHPTPNELQSLEVEGIQWYLLHT